MEFWDHTSFDNDAATDFAAGLLDSGGVARIEAALRVAIETEDYLEAEDGQQAVAAAEVVAAMGGQSDHGLYADLYAWAAAQPPASDSLKALALRALDRVMSPDSELPTLGADPDDTEWKAEMAALRGRLT